MGNALKRNSKYPGTIRELPSGARQSGKDLELTLKQLAESASAYTIVCSECMIRQGRSLTVTAGGFARIRRGTPQGV